MRFLLFAILVFCGSAHAAGDRIYKCGNEYTNAIPEGNPRGCKLLEGGNVDLVPYRGPGGQLEAMASIATVLSFNLATLKACGTQSQYAAESKRLATAYVSRNKPVYMAVMQGMPAIAQRNGGDAEVLRLKNQLAEILGATEDLTQAYAEIKAAKVGECSTFLRQVDSGSKDLRVMAADELRKLGL